MPDFSVIVSSPKIRALVQENILERAFHDALFPRMLFRGDAAPVEWPQGIGDTMVFTGTGLIPVDARPLVPGTDPLPVSYSVEQWTAQIQQYSATIDTHMPTSMVAIADLFLRNAQQLGMQAAQTLNRIVRDRMYNAALSGWSVCDGIQTAVTTLRVKRLNGFTKARNPNTAGASQVRFDAVSASNPLAIMVTIAGTPTARNVIGFTADVAGDDIGPGVLILDAATTVVDRAPIYALDRSYIVRVGGGNSVDSINSADIPTLADVRSAISHLWSQNVPEHPDMRFHAHIDPISQAKLFSDAEFQRLMTALPDYYAYKQFALGEMLNTVFFRNQECPTSDTVVGGSTATFDLRDPFAGELYNTGVITGTPIHRILFSGQGGIMEYWSDLNALITDAGIVGAVGEPQITNNAIEINSERIQFIIRAPLNRLQDLVSVSWKFIGDWPVRTDAASGDASRLKRFLAIEHGE